VGRFNFGTKAETLERLQGKLSSFQILPLLSFTIKRWREQEKALLSALVVQFPDQAIIVRSSTLLEDGKLTTHAGQFKSLLAIPTSNLKALGAAIDEVAASFCGGDFDQILVQPVLRNVSMSGVAMTRSFEDGAPYYVINYDDESGRTDSVTGGTHINKTVLIYRNAPLHTIRSERLLMLVKAIHELERVCGAVPLDIEFGMDTEGALYLFQVRRISLWQNWRAEVGIEVDARLPLLVAFVEERGKSRAGLVGGTSVFGVMPDWNPAEMIGTTPCRLAASLYRELITRSVWREGRAQMGYRRLAGEELMVLIGGHPYIDVRNSFNSFLPQDLDEDIASPLVEAWLARLRDHPEFHDKIEFEVALTCKDFSFDETLRERYPGVLDAQRAALFSARLQQLTNNCLELGPKGSLARAETDIGLLACRQQLRPLPNGDLPGGLAALLLVRNLLDECALLGALPFSIIARHAFIAEALLRSALRRGAFRPERLEAFKRSIRTVSGELAADSQAVQKGLLAPDAFLAKYGHLRPGTYDVRSLRYADRKNVIFGVNAPSALSKETHFALTQAERRAIDMLLQEDRYTHIDGVGLLEYARRSIAGREYAKFVFTRNISDALEGLIAWIEHLGLSRENLAHLGLDDVFSSSFDSGSQDITRHFARLSSKNKLDHEICRAIKMGFLICGPNDLLVVPLHRAQANFITDRHVHGPVAFVDASSAELKRLKDMLVCIEGADPGFDWIFTQGIAGLITKYGGANSHMAIRCAEFELPAAIGCGEQLFSRVLAAGGADLNCATKTIIPLYEH